MKELFIAKTFSPDSREMLGKLLGILKTYAAQGYDLSLRQLYYQCVAADLIPHDRSYKMTAGKWVRTPMDKGGSTNAEPNYKWIGDIVSDARLAGLIDWDAIKDRGRVMVKNSHWDRPADILQAVAQQFQIDKWADQPNYVELMVEKQALEGVLEPVCRTLDVAFTANKGYSSSSALYEAGKRIERKLEEGKSAHLIYLGDHDPSGIDMTRDVDDRISLFARANGNIEVHRIALNMDQIDELKPPENPAKLTDSRADAYIARFGSSSWELDAIEPRRLAQLVTTTVISLRDERLWKKAVARQDSMRAELKSFADKSKFNE